MFMVKVMVEIQQTSIRRNIRSMLGMLAFYNGLNKSEMAFNLLN